MIVSPMANPHLKVYSNEFIRLWEEGPQELTSLIYKYPLTTIISILALSIFGFMQLFSFSIACIPSGAIFVITAYGLGKVVISNYREFLPKAGNSILEFLGLHVLRNYLQGG